MTDQTSVENCVTKSKLLLKDLKNKLPIEDKSKQDQTFTFRDWGMPEEKHIAKLKDKNPSIGKFINKVFCYMLATLNGEDFQVLSEEQKMLRINQMPMGNVFYMYLYLRYDQLGNDIVMSLECPICSYKTKEFIADIGDVDVDCKIGNYDETFIYTLRKPVTLDKGNQLIEKLKLGLAKWNVMERADDQASANQAIMKELTFRNSIVSIEGIDTPMVPDQIISKLRKIDIEYIQRMLSEHNAGPTIVIDAECSKCGKSHLRAIDWSYDNFFGIGSLPRV